MKNTAIIIPSRMAAKRFPNKPLANIKGLPMIIHVLKRAKETGIKEIYVATPDQEIKQVVESNGYKAFLTKSVHHSGSDRIFEVYSNFLKEKVDLIINLQGDMPNIKPDSIIRLERFMRDNDCDIGTLSGKIRNNSDFEDKNIVKVEVDQKLNNEQFLIARDFFRLKKNCKNNSIYHHIGIYAFTSTAITKYVKFSRSKLEIERNLEQMRALENKMCIKVGLSDSIPKGIDTELDLNQASREID